MPISISNQVSSEAKKDILELEDKIERFKSGQIPEEKFKAYRLTRGVYGQRQTGVQMFRIKIPFGKLTIDQLVRIAEISEKYTNGNLHTTTRQNIQYHFVKLDDSPAIWADLADVGITAREACGNTVRTVTGSAKAGVDPNELFDISPYAQEVSDFFLRNPVCQDMGRKFKMAFSSSDEDSAFTYFHDLGFIPGIKSVNGKSERGFKVLLGGGLGAQAIHARPVFEFLHEDRIIPFIAAVIRVFDRFGEREKRFKARLKFLVDEKRGIGLEAFLDLVNKEIEFLGFDSVPINSKTGKQPAELSEGTIDFERIKKDQEYKNWFLTNVFEQKQKGWYSVQIKLPLGNIISEKVYKLAPILRKYAADDIRITVNQGLLLRFVSGSDLSELYDELSNIGLADYGFGTLADITACPGSDTCNLAVTNSTGLAATLEYLIIEEYNELVLNHNIHIKMSGCMNSCGQHMAASIGFHGSSIKNGQLVVPAMQVVLGGGVSPEGEGFIAEKIIKLPTKRIPAALRLLLNDYISNRQTSQEFNDYVHAREKKYFYDLLKALADLSELSEEDYHDWGQDIEFKPEIGVGECAGVMVDVIGAILEEASDKLQLAEDAIAEGAFGDSVYLSYSSFVIAAKGLLLSEDQHCNAHITIINDFQNYFVDSGKLLAGKSFQDIVLRINSNLPTASFAKEYRKDALEFLSQVIQYRKNQVSKDQDQIDKSVIASHYKA